MRDLLVAGVICAGVLSAPATHADPLCNRLKTFERAAFETDVAPDGLADRWIVLHWVGFWLDLENGFGKACRSSDDALSRNLCVWLVENSSTEFPHTLPFSMLECYGYRFPHPYPQWGGWKSEIELPGRRSMVLDVDFSGWETETGAIRLRVYRDKDGPWENPVPLAPLPREEWAPVPDTPP